MIVDVIENSRYPWEMTKYKITRVVCPFCMGSGTSLMGTICPACVGVKKVSTAFGKKLADKIHEIGKYETEDLSHSVYLIGKAEKVYSLIEEIPPWR